jgi:hypothetical protein
VNTHSILLTAFLTLATDAALPAASRDWFVRAGATGDGTQANPFGDPWEALAKCESGDVIHIAEGRYSGRLQSGEWAIPFDNVTLMGGYKADWSARDPWQFKSVLIWDINSKNRPKGERLTANVKGAVIDGITIDMMEENEYSDDKRSGRTDKSLSIGYGALRLTNAGTVRNCIFVNTGHEGVTCPVGSTIENNLFLNTYDCALKINSVASGHPDAKNPAIVKEQHVRLVVVRARAGQGPLQRRRHPDGGPGDDRQEHLRALRQQRHLRDRHLERTSITNNVFFMNLFSNLKLFVEGRDVPVDDKTMELLEECGLKAFDGNECVNPELPLDKDWLDATAKRTSPCAARSRWTTGTSCARSWGLPLQGSGGAPASGIAPAYALEKVAGADGAEEGRSQGRRPRRAVASQVGPPVGGGRPGQGLHQVRDRGWANQPETMDGKDLEMVVAISLGRQHRRHPGPVQEGRPRGHLPARQGRQRPDHGLLQEGLGGQPHGRRELRALRRQRQGDAALRREGHRLQHQVGAQGGVLHRLDRPLELGAVARTRPAGRDWFIRAGSTGGDGSKDKPFRDPFQALEKVEAGDTLHVAAGEYVGKLRMGYWKVDCT